LETFTGRAITAKIIQANINHPSNALNTESNARASFDRLEWGIEARRKPGGQARDLYSHRSWPLSILFFFEQWEYVFRKVRDYAATVPLDDGDEIVFCKGDAGQIVDPPDPAFCNLRLALARVMNASGASDIIAELYGYDDDDDAFVKQPVYLGGPFLSDDLLFRRLHDRLT
jgi:hypothetical protein